MSRGSFSRSDSVTYQQQQKRRKKASSGRRSGPPVSKTIRHLKIPVTVFEQMNRTSTVSWPRTSGRPAAWRGTWCTPCRRASPWPAAAAGSRAWRSPAPAACPGGAPARSAGRPSPGWRCHFDRKWQQRQQDYYVNIEGITANDSRWPCGTAVSPGARKALCTAGSVAASSAVVRSPSGSSTPSIS